MVDRERDEMVEDDGLRLGAPATAPLAVSENARTSSCTAACLLGMALPPRVIPERLG